MNKNNNEIFKKITVSEIPAVTYSKDGKEYQITESRLNINPLKEQGYHAVFQIYGTKGKDEWYQKVKKDVIYEINEKIGDGLKLFNDGIGEFSISEPQIVDCIYNNNEISYIMKLSMQGDKDSGIILLNFYNYPDDILVEMSIWTVDYEIEDKKSEILNTQDESLENTISHSVHEVTNEEKRKKQQINSIDWLWEKGIQIKNFILGSGIIIKIILLLIFLSTILFLMPLYIILGIIYGILYFIKNKKQNPIFIESKTKIITVYDWSGIRSLTQIRHFNFIKQKVEEVITDYMGKTGLKWEKSMVANYKPELLKEGMLKNINQNISNNFNYDLSTINNNSKNISIGENTSGGNFNIGNIE